MNQLDSPLSERGVRQAERLAERMADIPFDVLLSSDLGRAMATAQAIADRCGASIESCPALREQSLGIFEGLTWPEIEARYESEVSRYRADPDFAVPNGESRHAYHARTVACLTSLVDRFRGKTIVTVAHGGTLGVAIRHAMGVPAAAPNPARLWNASLNSFDVTGDVWKLRHWGDVAHLAGLP